MDADGVRIHAWQAILRCANHSATPLGTLSQLCLLFHCAGYHYRVKLCIRYQQYSYCEICRFTSVYYLWYVLFVTNCKNKPFIPSTFSLTVHKQWFFEISKSFFSIKGQKLTNMAYNAPGLRTHLLIWERLPFSPRIIRIRKNRNWLELISHDLHQYMFSALFYYCSSSWDSHWSSAL